MSYLSIIKVILSCKCPEIFLLPVLSLQFVFHLNVCCCHSLLRNNFIKFVLLFSIFQYFCLFIYFSPYLIFVLFLHQAHFFPLYICSFVNILLMYVLYNCKLKSLNCYLFQLTNSVDWYNILKDEGPIKDNCRINKFPKNHRLCK